MAKERGQVEKRLAAEWMATQYAGKTYYLNYPIGPVPLGITTANSAYPWLRKVDGLAVVDSTVHVVEFKVWSPWDGLDKLPIYKLGVPRTPWLGSAKDYPVKMILVTPRSNPVIEATAALAGIEVVSVSGGWIDEVVQHIEWLWSREGRDAMEERRKLRAWLGLE